MGILGPVWYICLKTENCYLKTFVEICVGEKVCGNTRNVIKKLKIVVWKHSPNTPLSFQKPKILFFFF